MSNSLIGFPICIISCIAFGFMFAPLKKFDCKDGFFVQWVQCMVAFVFGLIVYAWRGFPQIEPISCIGGFFFATGNIASVPIVQNLGIGIGMLIWGSVQITVGWCVARFGMFGTKTQPVYNNLMNVVGLILTLVSGVMFVFVRHGDECAEAQEDIPHHCDTAGSCDHMAMSSSDNSPAKLQQRGPVSERISRTKLMFVGLAVFLGILHGLMLTPIVYILDNYPEKSHNVLDFIFGHFCSMAAFSTTYFILYALCKRNRPYAPGHFVLPSALYGSLWSIGMILFFVSNQLLSQTVSFPITTRLPSTIGLISDVFLFKTIQGRKNLAFTWSAVAVCLAGVLLIALSNQQF